MRPGARARRTRAVRLAWVAALVACAGIASWLLLDEDARAQRRVVSRVPGARAVLRRAGGVTELSLAGMPQPPHGEVYEVWVARAGRAPASTGDLFMVTSDGRASVSLPGDLRGVRALLLTREPVGGSPAPTLPALLEVLEPAAASR